MKWHPFAEKFPLLEVLEFDALVESVKSTKGINEQPILYRMVKGKKEGLDGRNREAACKAAKIEPTYKLVSVKDEDVKNFIIRRNMTRRHLTPEFRQAIVAELRADGQSTRQIASALGVDQKTVRNDIGLSAGEENSSPEKNGSPTVTGADGKQYPARKNKKLCDRCQRVGVVQNCPACADLNRKAKSEKNKKSSDAGKQEDDGPKDCFGTPVPKNCRDVLRDPWIQESFDYLAVASENFRKQRLAERMTKKTDTGRFPMFRPKEFNQIVATIIQGFDSLIDHIKENRPEAICPACEGAGCGKCKRIGVVSRKLHKELKAAAKADGK